MNHLENTQGDLNNAQRHLISALGQLDEAGEDNLRDDAETLERKLAELKQRVRDA